MTPDDKIINRLANDLQYFAENNLYIKPKVGGFIPFKFNRSQEYLHKKLEEQKLKTGKVRTVICKGRQQGCSTYVGARFYHKTVTNQAMLTFIFAHDADASDGLFKMVKNYYDLSDPGFRPELGTSNAKELLFPTLGSGYKVGTAGTKAMGRSKTFQCLHWSETAFSPNADEHSTGILQTVADAPNTEIILESTAYASGDFFHRVVQQARTGESDWQLVFIPWYWEPMYSRNVPRHFTLSEKEAEYLRLYADDGLTKENLNWRRYKVDDDFEGDDVRFMREYPFNIEEAFTASDEESYIKAKEVIQARRTAIISSGSPLIIGIDPAREGGDRIAVCHRKGRNVTKIFKLPPMDITALSNRIAEEIRRYKPMLVNIDVGGLGIGVYDNLVALGFGDTVRSVNFGGSPDNRDRYSNKRAEMYGELKKWLLDTPCHISTIDRVGADALQGELTNIRYTWTQNQQLKLESKVDMKKRGVPSPDCFVAGTLVRTPYGQTPIEDLKDGDYVCTPFGRSRIIKKWVSETHNITTVRFSNGRTLKGKGSHKIFTWDKGWVNLDALKLTFTVDSWRDRWLWLMTNTLFTRERNLDFKQAVDIIARTTQENAKNITFKDFYIGGFGKKIMEKYQRVTSYITRTMTGQITQFQILNACQNHSIHQSTFAKDCKIRNTDKKIGIFSKHKEIRQNSGTSQRKELSGTKNMEKIVGKKQPKYQFVAQNAEKITKHISKEIKTFAAAAVGKKAITKIIRKLCSANHAEKILKSINTGIKTTAPISVQSLESLEGLSVYNLTLEQENAYYANDILVANCADSLALTFAFKVAHSGEFKNKMSEPVFAETNWSPFG